MCTAKVPWVVVYLLSSWQEREAPISDSMPIMLTLKTGKRP
jgi:hypothetical protein